MKRFSTHFPHCDDWIDRGPIVVNGHLTHNTSWQDIRKKAGIYRPGKHIARCLPPVARPNTKMTFRSVNEQRPHDDTDEIPATASGRGVKPGLTGIARILAASRNSLNGIQDAWRYEAAFRQNSVGSIVLLVLSFFLAQTVVEWLILVTPLFLLAIVELLNSAIENVVDRIGAERHILSGRAKDMGSAATMVCLILIGTVWISMAWSRYFA